jgi:hypothetical protein
MAMSLFPCVRAHYAYDGTVSQSKGKAPRIFPSAPIFLFERPARSLTAGVDAPFELEGMNGPHDLLERPVTLGHSIPKTQEEPFVSAEHSRSTYDQLDRKRSRLEILVV